MKSDILGILRFCMVLESPRGFPTLLDVPFEARERKIFSPDHVEQRLKLLSKIVLPSLANQDDQDFGLAIAISSNLPGQFQERLLELIAASPNTFLVEVPPRAILRQACRAAIKRGIASVSVRHATFRLDDDDALATDYISRLRHVLRTTSVSTAVTMAPGLEVTVSDSVTYRRDNRLCSGAGLALVTVDKETPERFLSVYQLGPHRKVGDHLPVIKFDDQYAFIRLIHGQNISGAKPADWGGIMPEVAGRVLRDRFAIKNRQSFEQDLMTSVAAS